MTLDQLLDPANRVCLVAFVWCAVCVIGAVRIAWKS
jgi:hypothetical protein